MADYINVHVHRGKSRISPEKEWFDVYTMEPFENNRANRDIINQLSKYFNVDYRNIEIVRGSTSRKKVVKIND
ncbi:MAG: DUF167 domain-containing protein [Ferroplasma sp.]|uniref:DUF167 domain-containing protein n=1 Tax=Ferroplasma sp. TaxID=2591003 RepID=UPI0028151B2F|nr:DUF167 domain-containing protein [Ferroplasma sp.]WMT51696.1 MAG: DUF167 domain-containing protein [Ferroplasma sp.]